MDNQDNRVVQTNLTPNIPVNFGNPDGLSEEEIQAMMQEFNLGDQSRETSELALAGASEENTEEYKFQTENEFFNETNLTKKAQQFNSEMKINKAILAAEADLASNEDNKEQWVLLGTLKQEGDQDIEAIYCLKKAIALYGSDSSPEKNSALVKLAVSYINECKLERCLSTIKQWTIQNEKYPEVKATLEIEDLTEEAKELEKVIKAIEKITPEDTQLLTLLGVIAFTYPDFDAAAESFKNAVKADPKDYSLWNKLGAAFNNSLKSDKAIICYETAMKLRPNLPRGWNNLGVAYNQKEDYHNALRCFFNCLSLNPSAVTTWSYIQGVYISKGEFDKNDKIAARDLDYFKTLFNIIDPNELPLPKTENLDESLQKVLEE
ncbi:unnamed protein product [Moneuplotes crassus]|uniref:Peroxin-5 n=1 Tax=Euplotes crassus TaxID=5936 RepID=A0AAD1UHP4_EUPCR|nr:unnamed protein product [Moneuplotes crassus]